LPLDLGSYLNLFDAVLILGVSIPTLFMSYKITLVPIRGLFVLFSLFLIFHGLYHLSYFLGDYLESDSVANLSNVFLEPAGYVLLLCFVIYYARRAG
jgi:hypothetical protein